MKKTRLRMVWGKIKGFFGRGNYRYIIYIFTMFITMFRYNQYSELQRIVKQNENLKYDVQKAYENLSGYDEYKTIFTNWMDIHRRSLLIEQMRKFRDFNLEKQNQKIIELKNQNIEELKNTTGLLIITE